MKKSKTPIQSTKKEKKEEVIIKEGKGVAKVIKKELTKEEKNKLIIELLEVYGDLPKKSNGEGRKIRRKLRRLGYYLSKIVKEELIEEEEEIEEKE